ncbi:MAG: hypothetical protein ABI640_13785 [Gammaproteobacteria bacterium]
MRRAKLVHNSTLAVMAIGLVHCSKGPEVHGSAMSPSSATLRLQVDSEHWPVDVLDLARTTITLVQQRGEPAYLTQIDIQLPQANESRPLTGVNYTFFRPKTRERLSVSYVNTDVSLSADEMRMAQQAGVADVMKRAQAATLMPQFTEMGNVEEKSTPMPVPGAQISLRDAYALARRNGLTHPDHVSLSVSTKDPNAPLVLWNFRGEHTQEDSQGIHIDALTGELVDEDRINDLSRAERQAQLQKALEALQSLARPLSAGGLGAGQTLVVCPAGYIHYGIGRDCFPTSNQMDPATIQGH